MNVKNIIKLGSFFLLSIILSIGCMEDISTVLPDLSLTNFSVRLTDDPVDLDEVNINLQKVIIKGFGEREEMELGTNAGFYNLLDYQNGLSTEIANSIVSIERIKEIRLVLGDDNFAVKYNSPENDTFDLKIPSGSSSGLKIKVCIDLTQTEDYELTLDFDAAASLHKTGNGRYMLKPVIRPLNADANCNGGDDEVEEEEIELENLPSTVSDYLADNFDDFEVEEISKDTLCGGTEVYYVEGETDDENYILAFLADDTGSWLQTATAIPVSEVPMAVAEVVIMDYSDYQLKKAYAIQNEDNSVQYRVELKHGNDNRTLILSPEGNLICEL